MSVDLPYKYQRAFSRSPLCDLIVIYNAGLGLVHGLVRPILSFSTLSLLTRARVLSIDPFGVAGGRITAAPEQRNPLGGSVQP